MTKNYKQPSEGHSMWINSFIFLVKLSIIKFLLIFIHRGQLHHEAAGWF